MNERVHRGFSSSLLLTFFMQLQCLFVTVSLCLCLRVLLCMCEYAGGLACSNVGYLKLARQLQGQFISWFGTEFSTFCSVVNINIQDCFILGSGGAMVSIMVRGSHKVNIALNVAKDTTDLSVMSDCQNYCQDIVTTTTTIPSCDQTITICCQTVKTLLSSYFQEVCC